jgi:hypothetical protein
MVPDVDRDDGRLVVLVDNHSEPVVKDKFFVWEINVLGLKRRDRKSEKQDTSQGKQ